MQFNVTTNKFKVVYYSLYYTKTPNKKRNDANVIQWQYTADSGGGTLQSSVVSSMMTASEKM